MENRSEKEIIEYLRAAAEPKSIGEVSEAFGYTATATRRVLNRLLESGDLIVVGASNNREYFIANNEGMTVGDYDKLKTKSLEMLVPAKAATDSAKDEIKVIRNEIKNIYSNFISIMAVFVAIFSIVFSGASFLFQIANGEWTWQAIRAFLVTECGIVGAIIVMLLGIKLFLHK